MVQKMLSGGQLVSYRIFFTISPDMMRVDPNGKSPPLSQLYYFLASPLSRFRKCSNGKFMQACSLVWIKGIKLKWIRAKGPILMLQRIINN